MKAKTMIRLYLYNEIENWEWKYSRLIDLIVDEFDDDDIKQIDDNFSYELVREVLKKEVEKFCNVETVATDELNERIKNNLKDKIN